MKLVPMLMQQLEQDWDWIPRRFVSLEPRCISTARIRGQIKARQSRHVIRWITTLRWVSGCSTRSLSVEERLIYVKLVNVFPYLKPLAMFVIFFVWVVLLVLNFLYSRCSECVITSFLLLQSYSNPAFRYSRFHMATFLKSLKCPRWLHASRIRLKNSLFGSSELPSNFFPSDAELSGFEDFSL